MNCTTHFERSNDLGLGESHVQQADDGGAVEHPGRKREVIDESAKTTGFRN